MKKYILKDLNQEVKFGDRIIASNINSSEKPNFFINTILSKDNVDILIKEGIIEVVNDLSLYYLDYFNNHMKKVGYNNNYDESAITWFCNTYGYSSLLYILLKEIAEAMDGFYKTSISEGSDIYAISLTNGKVAKVKKDSIVNYNNFAAFRSFEDAETARLIVKPILAKMFPENY